MTSRQAPDRYRLADNLEISRMVTGLWQVADMERGGTPLDPERASSSMLDYSRTVCACWPTERWAEV